MDLDAFLRRRRMLPVAFSTSFSMSLHRLLRLFVLAMRHQPARALRYETAEQQNAEAEHGSDTEAETPADIRREQALIEQKRDRERAAGRAQPEAAVDDEVDTSAIFAGMSSSIAELTAAYSPPMPSPVIIRKIAKLQKSQANALSSTPDR